MTNEQKDEILPDTQWRCTFLRGDLPAAPGSGFDLQGHHKQCKKNQVNKKKTDIVPLT